MGAVVSCVSNSLSQLTSPSIIPPHPLPFSFIPREYNFKAREDFIALALRSQSTLFHPFACTHIHHPPLLLNANKNVLAHN